MVYAKDTGCGARGWALRLCVCVLQSHILAGGARPSQLRNVLVNLTNGGEGAHLEAKECIP